MACSVATAALNVLLDENMVENAREMGKHFRSRLKLDDDVVVTVQAGLLNAIEIRPREIAQRRILLDVDEAGSSRETPDHIVRLAPPLCISRDEVDAAADIIGDCVRETKKAALR